MPKAVKNPFAERMKKGYSVAIHYGTEDGKDIDMDRLKSILERPGLKSLHLYFNENGK